MNFTINTFKTAGIPYTIRLFTVLIIKSLKLFEYLITNNVAKARKIAATP